LAAGRHGVLVAGGDEVMGVGKLADGVGVSVVVGALSVFSVTVVASVRQGIRTAPFK
jgi:hypothetical protein